MAGFTDALTAVKNIVTALNGAAQTYLGVQGSLGYTNLSVPAVVHTGAGRICEVIVTLAGSTPGGVYDSNSTAVTTNQIFVIPNTVGVYVVNFPVSNGVLIVPGSGQVVAISHS